MLTRHYLKENQLFAVPFIKGIGVYVMSKETYNETINKITYLPQFQKVDLILKNGKNPVFKEEERIVSILKQMNNQGKLDESLIKSYNHR